MARETKCECTIYAVLHNKFSEILNQRETPYFLVVTIRPKFSETIINVFTFVFLKFGTAEKLFEEQLNNI